MLAGDASAGAGADTDASAELRGAGWGRSLPGGGEKPRSGNGSGGFSV